MKRQADLLNLKKARTKILSLKFEEKILKKITVYLLLAAVLFCFTSCSFDENEEPYTSLRIDQTTEEGTVGDADFVNTSGDAYGISTSGDAVYVNYYSTASLNDAAEKYGSAIKNEAGFIYSNAYYNYLTNTLITTNGDSWRLCDSEEIAEYTGVDADKIKAFKDGEISAADNEVSYCAMAYNYNTASSIAVYYFNPGYYNISNMTAEQYLEIIASQYENVEKSKVEFIGQSYAMIDIPASDERNRMVEYAIEKDGLLYCIAISLKDDMTYEEAASIIGTVY